MGAKKTKSHQIPVAKIPLLSRITVLEFRLEIRIVPGLGNPPGSPTLNPPLRLGQVGEGWKWGGWSRELLFTTPWISCLLALRLLHKIFHVPTKRLGFKTLDWHSPLLSPSRSVLGFPPWDHTPAFSWSCFPSLARWAGLGGL